MHSNEMNKYARGRRTTRSCLKISESLYNILELVAKDQITNEKAIVVANKDRKMKRKQAKTAGKLTMLRNKLKHLSCSNKRARGAITNYQRILLGAGKR